jgi:tetratricopeptide (TPR) repeat protein
MNNNFTTEKLIDYIDGALMEDEAKVIEQSISTNEGLKLEYDNLLAARKAIKHYGLIQRVANVRKQMKEEETITKQKKQSPVIRLMPKRAYRIAAGIILLVGVFGLYQYITISGKNLYSEKYTAYNMPNFRGSNNNSQIEKAYSDKNYDAVISTYTSAQNNTANEIFLTGQAYLQKNDFTDAIACFNKLLAQNKAADTHVLNDDAEYYLALAYLQNNNLDKATALFKNIGANKSHLYNKNINGWFLKKLQILKFKQ